MCQAAEASKRVLPRFVGWYDEAPARRPRRPIGAPAGRIATDRGGASADHAYVTAGWRACRRPDSTKQNVPDSNYPSKDWLVLGDPSSVFVISCGVAF